MSFSEVSLKDSDTGGGNLFFESLRLSKLFLIYRIITTSFICSHKPFEVPEMLSPKKPTWGQSNRALEQNRRSSHVF